MPLIIHFVILAGTNDVQRTRSEELMAEYKKMIQKYNTKYRNIIISRILMLTSMISHSVLKIDLRLFANRIYRYVE